MNFHVYRHSELLTTPWKNGGGSTREIFKQAADSNLHDFNLRCSIADVTSSGPFSIFPNHKRQIIQLSGPSMRLLSPQFSESQTLTLMEPFNFDGSWSVDCEVDSPTTDFNFMIHRSWGKFSSQNFSSIKSTNMTLQIPPSEIAVYFVLSGEVSVDLAQGDSSGSLYAFDTIVLQNSSKTKVPYTLRLIGKANVIGYAISPN